LCNELNALNLDNYIVNEIPINTKLINNSIKDGKYVYALLEIHRVVCILSNSVKGMTEQSILLKLSQDNHGNEIRRGSRGVMKPTEEEDDDDDDVLDMTGEAEPVSSPIKSNNSSLVAARNAAAASLKKNLIKNQQQASGNIRVATKIATLSNGYDSDIESNNGVGGQSSERGAAWQTPRDGVSLRGNGGGIRRGSRSKHPSSQSSRTPSEADVQESAQKMLANSLFGDEHDNNFNRIENQKRKDEEEERSCKTIRQQMKQVTSMVLYRAKKMTSKVDKKKDGPSHEITINKLQIPKSPRRRSIMIDNDEDDFSRLIHSVGAHDALGLSSTNDKLLKPKKPRGKKGGRGRRGSVVKRKKRRAQVKTNKETVTPSERSISASTEF
jgi:hypothetical protein